MALRFVVRRHIWSGAEIQLWQLRSREIETEWGSDKPLGFLWSDFFLAALPIPHILKAPSAPSAEDKDSVRYGPLWNLPG